MGDRTVLREADVGAGSDRCRILGGALRRRNQHSSIRHREARVTCRTLGTDGPLGTYGTLWAGRAKDTRILVFIVLVITARLSVIAAALTAAVLPAVALMAFKMAIHGSSHKRILSVHRMTSLEIFGEAPLQDMSKGRHSTKAFSKMPQWFGNPRRIFPEAP